LQLYNRTTPLENALAMKGKGAKRR
jgi:hypothetical protein